MVEVMTGDDFKRNFGEVTWAKGNQGARIAKKAFAEGGSPVLKIQRIKVFKTNDGEVYAVKYHADFPILESRFFVFVVKINNNVKLNWEKKEAWKN